MICGCKWGEHTEHTNCWLSMTVVALIVAPRTLKKLSQEVRWARLLVMACIWLQGSFTCVCLIMLAFPFAHHSAGGNLGYWNTKFTQCSGDSWWFLPRFCQLLWNIIWNGNCKLHSRGDRSESPVLCLPPLISQSFSVQATTIPTSATSAYVLNLQRVS